VDVVQDGEIIYDGVSAGPIVESDDGGCDAGCDVGSSCAGPWQFDLCNTCFEPSRLCICLPSHGWVQADYLMWWQDGMNIPPLLATSPAGTTANATARLGRSSTSVLLGDEDILTDRMNGGRLRFGWWFANNPNLGIEGEYFALGTQEESFVNQGTGSPLLGRPFFNTATGEEDAQLVSFPGIVTGSFRVDATSNLKGAAVRFRRAMCCGSGCSYSWLCCGPVPTQSRIDLTLGWRYLQLNEGLSMEERLDSQVQNDPGSFLIRDRFRTRNQFNGVELGVLWQGRRGYWSLDGLMRLSIGNMRQTVMIDGSTQIAIPGQATQTFSTGVLTQRSNIGDYFQDRFAVVPELGANLGYQLTQRTRLMAGYTFIYASNVVRPGDQIDTNINENLLAPEQTLNNQALRPQFRFMPTDYWVQGLNLGAEYRW
jgi:hypothetical protein